MQASPPLTLVDRIIELNLLAVPILLPATTRRARLEGKGAYSESITKPSFPDPLPPLATTRPTRR